MDDGMETLGDEPVAFPEKHVCPDVQSKPEAAPLRVNFKQASRIIVTCPHHKDSPLLVEMLSVIYNIEPDSEEHSPAPEPQVQGNGKHSLNAEGSTPKRARTTPVSADVTGVEREALTVLLGNLFSSITTAVQSASTPQSLMDLQGQLTHLIGAAEMLGSNLSGLKDFLRRLAAQGLDWRACEAAAEPHVPVNQIQALEAELAHLRDQAAITVELAHEKRSVARQMENDLDKLQSNWACLIESHATLLEQFQKVEAALSMIDKDMNVKMKQYYMVNTEAHECEQKTGLILCRSKELEAQIEQLRASKVVDPEARALADQAAAEATSRKDELLEAIKQMRQDLI